MLVTQWFKHSGCDAPMIQLAQLLHTRCSQTCPTEPLHIIPTRNVSGRMPVQVLKLQNLSQINERCLELQRSKTSSRKAAAAETSSSSQQVVSLMQSGKKRRQGKKAARSGCPYLSVEGGSAGWDGLTDLMLAAPVDVEELANLGRKKKVSRTGYIISACW